MSTSKPRFTFSQLNRISEIFGNITVAWFTAGVIAPFFTKLDSDIDLIANVLISLILSGLFAYLSIEFVKKVK